MTSAEIRKRYLDFFTNRGHAVLSSAPLIPKNDPSVLFNTAGMQPLVPYLLGEPHPSGKRLVDAQKCVRTQDIEEVGDNTHHTFFEMLGNWSLGDYFKEDAIKWSFEFLTSKEEGLGLDPVRLYVTVFGGNEDAPKDHESYEIWKKYIPENRIYFLTWNGKKEPNWWDAGANGPCGPDTEMFYDLTEQGLGDLTKEEYLAADERQDVVEIWNDVFMEYLKKDGKVVDRLSLRNVDTGSGLERITAAVQHKKSAYETDLFLPALAFLTVNTGTENDREARIIVDHIRTSMFMIADGVFPANKDQGYILRRLIRRATKYLMSRVLLVEKAFLEGLITELMTVYDGFYPELLENKQKIVDTIYAEIQKFGKTLQQGLKEFEKGTEPFILATSYGFPIELTEELAQEKGWTVDRKLFDEKMKAHQDLSRSGAEQKFKGGLANTSEQTTKLHTAHHLLLAALQEILSKDIHQKGSNITEERLRIDFNFDRKITPEELEKIENLVNEKITEDLQVTKREMSLKDAEKLGAEMEFGTKYPDLVNVYMIHDASDNIFSKEFCGGPHVTHTGELGKFKIQKEEASAQGIRRIKATLL